MGSIRTLILLCVAAPSSPEYNRYVISTYIARITIYKILAILYFQL